MIITKFIINEYYYNYDIKDEHGKHGLVDKETNKIVLEPIYDSIINCDTVFMIRLGKKLGLADKKTGKILLEPNYSNNINGSYREDYEALLKIYKQKLLLQEKLKQLKEDLTDGL